MKGEGEVTGPIEPKKKRTRKRASPPATVAAASGEPRPSPPTGSPDAPIKSKRKPVLSRGRKPTGSAPRSRARTKKLIGATLPEETAPKSVKASAAVEDTKARGPRSERATAPAMEWLKECSAKIEAAEERDREKTEHVRKLADAEAEKAERLEGVKRGRGRPTDYREWMCDAVVDMGREGMEVVEFAVALGVCRDTLYEWADKHAEFSDALTRAREASEAWHIKNVRGQAQLPAQFGNLTGYLGYMKCRFPGWREMKDEGPKTVPVSNLIKQGRERVAKMAREARESAAREAGI